MSVRKKNKGNNHDAVAVKCTMTWPFLNRKNDLADKYTLDCSHLSKEDARMLKNIGLPVKRDKKPDDPEKAKKWVDRGLFVSVKNTKPPEVYGPDRKRLSEEMVGKIANGSRAVVTIRPYDWDFGGRSGVGGGMGTIVVFKLVEYKGNDKSVDELADLIDEDEVDDESFAGISYDDTSSADNDDDLDLEDGDEDSDSDDDDEDEFDDDEMPF